MQHLPYSIHYQMTSTELLFASQRSCIQYFPFFFSSIFNFRDKKHVSKEMRYSVVLSTGRFIHSVQKPLSMLYALSGCLHACVPVWTWGAHVCTRALIWNAEMLGEGLSRWDSLCEPEHSGQVRLHIANCSGSRTEEEASPGHRLLPTRGK